LPEAQREDFLRFSPRFYRVAGICSFISAATTLCLIFLPRLYPRAASFEQNIALIENPIYTLRLWIYLFHPVFVLTAAMGVAVRLASRRASLVLPGFLLWCLWAFTEMIQQSLALVANHYAWRAGYESANESVRAMIRTQMFGFDAIWDALYVLLLIGFIGGNVLYAAAFRNSAGLGRALLVFYFLAAVRVFNFLSAFNIATWAGPAMSWIYPLLQPAARVSIGVWLWKQAKDVEV
jgi:hypothetical protein